MKWKIHTLVDLIKKESQRLVGFASTYEQYIDKHKFIENVEMCLSNLEDLKNQLKEEIENDKTT